MAQFSSYIMINSTILVTTGIMIGVAPKSFKKKIPAILFSFVCIFTFFCIVTRQFRWDIFFLFLGALMIISAHFHYITRKSRRPPPPSGKDEEGKT